MNASGGNLVARRRPVSPRGLVLVALLLAGQRAWAAPGADAPPLAETLVIVRAHGDGAAIAGARVRVGGREAVTDGRGRAVVALEAGREHLVEVDAALHDAARATVLVRAGRRERLVLWLHPADEDAEVVEVEVERTPTSAGARVRSQEELRRTAGALGDPIRALETSPAVSPVAPGDPGLVVRGAEPTHTAVRIDGIEVPWLYHWYFLRSVVDPSRIEAITFHPGGLTAATGGFAQGLVEVTSADLARGGGFEGRASLDLLDVALAGRARVGGWHLLASGRLSWGGELLGLAALAASHGQAYVPARFSDYAARVTGDLGDHRLTLTVLGAADALRVFPREDDEGEATADLPYDPTRPLDRQFHRAQVRLRSRGAWGTSDVGVVGGLDLDRNTFDSVTPIVDSAPGPTFGALRSWRVGVRAHWRLPLRGGWWIDVGAEGDAQHAVSRSFDQAGPGEGEAPEERTWLASVAPWLGAEVQARRTWVAAGVRASAHLAGDGWVFAPEPRLVVRSRVHDRVAWSMFASGTSQRPPAWQVSERDPRAVQDVRSWQVGTGLALELPRHLHLDVQGYGTWFPSVTVQRDVARLVHRPAEGPGLAVDVAPGWVEQQGASAGAEVELRWRPHGGQLGVALAAGRSWRWDALGSAPSERDRPFRGTVWGAWEPGRRWTLSGRLLVAAGAVVPSYETIAWPQTGGEVAVPDDGEPGRGRWHHQLDLRVAKTFVARRAHWTLYLEVFNATGRKIPLAERLDPVTGALEPVLWIPVLPVLGLEVRF